MRKIFVTGASGFIGKDIAADLKRKGYAVRACRHDRAVAINDVETVDVDITRPDELIPALEGVDTVVHGAALIGAWHRWDDLYRTNVEGTKNVVDRAIESGVEHIIYLSSTAVMNEHIDHKGTDETGFHDRTDLDSYSNSKIMAELAVRKYTDKIRISVIRPGWVWGPGSSELKKVCDMLRTGSFIYPGPGTNRLNLVYIDSIVAAVTSAIERRAQGTYIVTDGQGVTLNEFIGAFCASLGTNRDYLRLPYSLCYNLARLSETGGQLMNREFPTRLGISNLGRSLEFNTEKARRELDFKPKVAFADGVQMAADWYRGLPR